MSEWNDAIEAAAALMDRWAGECDPDDYNEALHADQFRHNAAAIRRLKREEQTDVPTLEEIARWRGGEDIGWDRESVPCPDKIKGCAVFHYRWIRVKPKQTGSKSGTPDENISAIEPVTRIRRKE